jgi:O-antigen ligase
LTALAERIATPVPVVAVLTAGAAGLLGLLAGYDPKLAVAAAFGLAFVVVVLQDLTIGLCLMAVLAFVDAMAVFGGALSLAKVAGVILGLSWLATLAMRDHDNLMRRHPVFTYALVLFLGWSAISYAWAEDKGATVEALIRYAPNVLLIPIAFTAVRSSRHVEWVVGALVAGAVLTAVIAILGPASDPSAVGTDRAEGLAGGANELAAALVVGLVMCLVLAMRQQAGSLPRLLLLGAGGLCVLGIALSLSRGGLIALAGALIAGVLVGGRWRGKMVLAAIAVVSLAVLWFSAFASLPARERVTEVGGGGTGRTDLWTVGWRMVEDRPLEGVGAGNFPVASIHYLLQPGALARDDFVITSPKVAHNTLLQVLAETGVVGAALFTGILLFCVLSTIAAARRYQRDGNERMELLARGLFVAIVGYLVAAFFISENYSKLMWLLLALGPAVHAVARRESSSSS